jgi:hypothetical protein
MQPMNQTSREQQMHMLEREAKAIVQTVHILNGKGHRAWITQPNKHGQPQMQTEATVPPEAVLEAIATAWIRLGEPHRKLACINHFLIPSGRVICKLRTCAQIAASPGAHCGA